jgi:hypothetical protein
MTGPVKKTVETNRESRFHSARWSSKVCGLTHAGPADGQRTWRTLKVWQGQFPARTFQQTVSQTFHQLTRLPPSFDCKTLISLCYERDRGKYKFSVPFVWLTKTVFRTRNRKYLSFQTSCHNYYVWVLRQRTLNDDYILRLVPLFTYTTSPVPYTWDFF